MVELAEGREYTLGGQPVQIWWNRWEDRWEFLDADGDPILCLEPPLSPYGAVEAVYWIGARGEIICELAHSYDEYGEQLLETGWTVEDLEPLE